MPVDQVPGTTTASAFSSNAVEASGPDVEAWLASASAPPPPGAAAPADTGRAAAAPCDVGLALARCLDVFAAAAGGSAAGGAEGVGEDAAIARDRALEVGEGEGGGRAGGAGWMGCSWPGSAGRHAHRHAGGAPPGPVGCARHAQVQCCTALGAVQRFEKHYCLNVPAMGSSYLATRQDLVLSFLKVRRRRAP